MKTRKAQEYDLKEGVRSAGLTATDARTTTVKGVAEVVFYAPEKVGPEAEMAESSAR